MVKERIRLDDLDQSKSIEHEEYKRLLKDYQLRILEKQLVLKEKKRALLVVMEGPDAAGKGGAIKRMVERLDPRLTRVYSIIKPTPEEYSHHYMWRFWNKLPPYGHIVIFDRSWYGRVLVERVEGFATEAEWKRAYSEINQFEKCLTDDGHGILKLYLHITKDEQLDRFKRRESDPYKHWKITDEDWRNRKNWDLHNQAAEDMFERTSTEYAPWQVIPANFKWYVRVQAVKALHKAMTRLIED
jgi:polyphosphate kinase 2 (PPK2 family)